MSLRSTVLGFDTSGPYCAAAIYQGGRIQVERNEAMAKGQAECLMPILEEALSEAGLDWKDLDRIGVGIGPGNFTGIRIAVSAARGLALALGMPAIGISAFEALAHHVPGPALACIDGRRGGIGLQLFGRDVFPDWGPQIADLETLPPEIMHPGISCVGFDAQRLAEAIGGAAQPAAYSPASAIAMLAAERNANPGERPAPLYLRDADAAPQRASAPPILP